MTTSVLEAWLDRFLPVPAGRFTMGDARLRDEAPPHVVEVSDFSLGVVPVTNFHYARFVEAGGYAQERWWHPDGWAWRHREQVEAPAFWKDSRYAAPLQPVVGVTWYEALAYCGWLSELLGQRVRLPTEAEWERAARGDDGRLWSWGAQWEAAAVTTGGARGPSLVIAHETFPGPYGHLDLSGNVYEWVSTRWGRNWQQCDYPYPYRGDDGRESLDGRFARCMRGGSWYDAPQAALTPMRSRYLPASRGSNIGFRVVVE